MKLTGVVKNFNKDRGYGFVLEDKTQKEYFFHFSNLVMQGFKNIEAGARVTFQVIETERGVQADAVTKI